MNKIRNVISHGSIGWPGKILAAGIIVELALVAWFAINGEWGSIVNAAGYAIALVALFMASAIINIQDTEIRCRDRILRDVGVLVLSVETTPSGVQVLTCRRPPEDDNE
ncbi:hypothetical protein AALF15_01250 [Corynebacteriaceae bacterium 7-707]